MFFGRVVGAVVATSKDPMLRGCKLLVVQRTDCEGAPEGGMIVAVDTRRAGPGDFVCLAKGKEASLPFGDMKHPVDAAIIGILDSVTADFHA